MPVLDPSPAALADLLARTTELDWPTTEEERVAFFAALGLDDADEASSSSRQVAGLRSRWFVSGSAGAVRGLASTFRDELLGLGLFAYNEQVEDGEAARMGYRDVRDHLSRRLGPPVEEWGSAAEPACLWRPGELVLDLCCFQRLRSGIMAGPAHTVRSDAVDAAAALPDGTDDQT